MKKTVLRNVIITATATIMLAVIAIGLSGCQHEHAFTEWITVKEATCEDNGLLQRYCTECNYTASKSVDALGHTEVTDSAVAPTCTTTGLTAGKHCSVCNNILIAQELVGALGHTEVEDSAVEATCVTTGLTAGKHCSVCNEIFVKQEIVSALGHNYSTTVLTEPTATADGLVECFCSPCGDLYTEVVIPKAFTITAENRSQIGYIGEKNESLVIPAVFQTDGTWYRVTSVSSGAFQDCSNLVSVVIPDSVTSIGNSAFYHCNSLTSVTIGNSVTGIGIYAFYCCDKLVEVINHSNLSITAGSTTHGDVAYYAKEVHQGNTKIVNQNGYLFYTYNGVNYLLGYVGADTALTLPNNYNGQNYEIDQYAFLNCDSLTSITIPDGVTSIGYAAFYHCSSLTSVTIGNSVTNIGEKAFADCSSLTSVTIGNSVTSIGNSAFHYCSSLTSVTIGNSVTSIGNYAFDYCISLTSITIPDNVTSIGFCAFRECSSLTSVTIPDSVTSIGNSAFAYCSSLKSITLPFVGATKDGTSNTHFGYIFGASSDSYNSRYVPASLKTVVITGSSSIGDDAFYKCSSLTSITIPEGVTSIGKYAFYKCSSLTSITIPKGVTSIGDYAFAECSSLTSITFGGTKVEWNAVTKGSRWNDNTGTYTVHCTDDGDGNGYGEWNPIG